MAVIMKMDLEEREETRSMNGSKGHNNNEYKTNSLHEAGVKEQ